VSKVSTEQALNKAYRLAYFLHQDKTIAIRIVAAATLKLNVAMAVQSKRLSYIPVGRFSRGESRRTDGIRNKALFSDLHLLQRLVYGESEPYERHKERAAMAGPPGVHSDENPASEADLLVYFIKHLVRITTKRNAFYVTLGVSRLLHSYSTLETMEIYNAVIGEPERVKDDYYYRSRKAVLMQEMYERFGQLIRACRQRRGEERFETQQGSSELRSLVRECLRLFTPWDTQCSVPRDFDPLKSVIAALTSKRSADENEIEVNRIHAILHPDCFEKLVAAFGYGAPVERIELPRFFSDQSDDQSPPRQRSAPNELNPEELAEINHLLDEQSGRRRRSSPTAVIRVMVDGVERGRLNPAEESNISFTVDENAELIEVKTTDPDGDLLLATHLLTSFAHEGAIVSSIRLEGGQDLSLSISRSQEETNGGAAFVVKFGYRETDLQRAARLWWQRVGVRRSPESARLILVASVLVICLMGGYLGYVALRSRETSGPPQAGDVQATSGTNPTGPAASAQVNDRNSGQDKPIANANLDQSSSQPPQRVKTDKATPAAVRSVAQASAGAVPQAQVVDEDADARTRSGNVVANLKLSDVKKIYIDIRGASANELRSSLGESLGSSGVVAAATNTEDADAALKIIVSETGAGAAQIEASARLVNAHGAVLWPTASRGSRRYSGESSKIVAEIVTDLLSEIRLARTRAN